jgi:hypothetical protein
MTGSVGNLSFYTIAGSDKVIVRTKGGASKKKLRKRLNLKNCANINRNGEVACSFRRACAKQ